ncbi:MAG TPA: DUF1552 domain-containing protein [Steroidobacteraceae bacterium]
MAVFLTKKHLSRRTFLRGGSVALALPFLDAMVPAATPLAQTAAVPKTRAGFFYIPHGAIMNNTPFGKDVDAWTSTGKGADFKLGHIVAPLEPLKKYVTTFDNIENTAAGGSVHTLNPATWLSCVRPDTQAKGASMAITLDQIIAQKLGQTTALPSLEVASETTIQVAACGGAGCYYASTTSYAGPNAPLPMEYNPRKVFIQLMGEGDTAAEREALLHKNTSILDMVSERAKALSANLGPGDQARLSDYLDTVREIERRVNMASARDLKGVKVPDAPRGELEDFDKQVRLMFDLIALAYQADLTRVASYVMVAEGTNRTYNHVGVPDSFHPVSHHSNDRERIRRLTVIQRYHMERFADFLQKLANTKEGDGSILDHSLFLYGSNMGNSNLHDNYPLPEVLVGGANGAHVGGKNISPPARTPLANVHLTILSKLGIKQDKFANSTGILAEV